MRLEMNTPRDDRRISSISAQVFDVIEMVLITVVGPEPLPRGRPAPSLRPPHGMSTAYHRRFEPGKSEKARHQRLGTSIGFVGPGRIDFYDPTAMTTWTHRAAPLRPGFTRSA